MKMNAKEIKVTRLWIGFICTGCGPVEAVVDAV
jgi:hypothetical protein